MTNIKDICYEILASSKKPRHLREILGELINSEKAPEGIDEKHQLHSLTSLLSSDQRFYSKGKGLWTVRRSRFKKREREIANYVFSFLKRIKKPASEEEISSHLLSKNLISYKEALHLGSILGKDKRIFQEVESGVYYVPGPETIRKLLVEPRDKFHSSLIPSVLHNKWNVGKYLFNIKEITEILSKKIDFKLSPSTVYK